MNQNISEIERHKKVDELRKKLNDEIKRNNYDLNAPSVMRISAELDRYINEDYRKRSS